MEPQRNTIATSLAERIFAVLGVIICLVITIPIWRSTSAQQLTWPLPALYFIEMLALSIISAFLFIRGNAWGRVIIWGAVGLIFGFSILGALSVGFFYLPVAIIFAGISITSDLRNKQRIRRHLAVCLVAGIAQVVLMFAAIRLLYPGVFF